MIPDHLNSNSLFNRLSAGWDDPDEIKSEHAGGNHQNKRKADLKNEEICKSIKHLCHDGSGDGNCSVC